LRADARIVDERHGGRDSDYAIARNYRAHELCRRQAQPAKTAIRLLDVDVQWRMEGICCVPEVRIAAL
jgi:hypothetical protein